jgi:hypothetical protein
LMGFLGLPLDTHFDPFETDAFESKSQSQELKNPTSNRAWMKSSFELE